MSNRIQTEGLVLHARRYRETSLHLELFTRDMGRLGAIALGAARSKGRGPREAELQPFQDLALVLQGQDDLRTLTGAEPTSTLRQLRGRNLYCALYLNEILCRLIARLDPQPGLYDSYRASLDSLVQCRETEPVLRHFERLLLEALGYGFSWQRTFADGAEIIAEGSYRFVPEAGFEKTPTGSTDSYPGGQLLDIADGRIEDAETLQTAKKIMRAALRPYLGDRPLASRTLFVMPQRS